MNCFSSLCAVVSAAVVISSASIASGAVARLLHTNGPIITTPNGGTGVIAGQSLSRPETFPLSATLNGSTAGVTATASANLKLADDFYVPDGGWDLDQITVYAYQNPPSGGTFSQTITTVKINLWNATPYTTDSPSLPPGTVIPQPLLAQPLVFDVTGQGTFVAHRTSGSSTTTIRPIYSYTVSADGLPNNGRLDAGHYWLEMSFDDSAATHATAFVPLATPRTSAFNLNARQFAVPFTGSPYTWFEGREGFGTTTLPEGRPYALPFELVGTPEPATLLTLGGTLSIAAIRRKRQ